MRSTVKVETVNQEEAVALASEILRLISKSESLRENLHAACYPTTFPSYNFKTQDDHDEKYLTVFKELYLEKFCTYIEECIEEYEMTNESKDELFNQPSSNVTHNFYAPVGAVQTGNQNVANVNQSIGQNLSDILEQLAILRNEFQYLPDGEKEEALEVIDAIAHEVKSENPSKGKIKSFLLSTKNFAMKTGTELAASTIAKLLESQMGFKS